jgi:hypothetical protein
VEVFDPASTRDWPLRHSQSQSYVTTDGHSANISMNEAPIWGLRPDVYYCQTVAGLLMWGALSDERKGLLFAWVTVSTCQHAQFTLYMLLSVCMYNIYKRTLSLQAQYSRSWPILSISCYNSSLVTWTVVCLTAAKFKPLIFPMSRFALSSVVNICNYVTFYDPVADRWQNIHLNRSSVVICVSVAMVMRVYQTSVQQRSIPFARRVCSAKRRPADGHIPAFGRHVTIL